jgi:hypothetical protein
LRGEGQKVEVAAVDLNRHPNRFYIKNNPLELVNLHGVANRLGSARVSRVGFGESSKQFFRTGTFDLQTGPRRQTKFTKAGRVRYPKEVAEGLKKADQRDKRSIVVSSLWGSET